MGDDIKKIYTNLPKSNKKILEEYDQRIQKVLDKNPRDFFDARKNGGGIYDADILGMLKRIDFAMMAYHPDNNRRVLMEVSNKIYRLYE